MKYLYQLLIVIITIFQLYALKISDLVNDKGEVTPAIIELLGLTGVRIEGQEPRSYWPEGKIKLQDKKLETVTRLIQGKDDRYPHFSWLQGQKKERWEMQWSTDKSSVEEKLLDVLLGHDKLNLMAATLPSSSEVKYDGIVLLGSTLMNFAQRVDFLNGLIDTRRISLVDASGKKIPIFIFTGRRSLNDEEKKFLKVHKEDALLEKDDEAAGLVWVYNKDRHRFLADHALVVIDDRAPAPMKRATTESTIQAAFEKPEFKSGHYLVISSNVFVLYQDLIFKRVLRTANKNDINVETIGGMIPGTSTMPSSLRIGILLDNLARIFYEIIQEKLSRK